MSDHVFVLDVDGVMTTGQSIYSACGKEYKVFGPHDSDGLKLIKDDVDIRFISADQRGFPISKKRIVDDLGFSLELVAEKDRMEYIVEKYVADRLIFMGDGIFDVPILEYSLFGIAPNNARIEAKQAADFVTNSNAGEGAVLDACLCIRDRYLEL